ncbi:hypothetical protein QUF81_11295 [Peribacillus simplex]|uniref:hypothetical protein n=1 Tax=Peribacillus simplex TaxID=1478 RepID=UPI00259FFF25|nr:hypothetical protein [Peribacillus simplex]MDM5293762.1 hypothetical protein [Peribacillus simplex]
MKRRNFLWTSLLLIFGFFFGYTVKKEGDNLIFQRLDILKDSNEKSKENNHPNSIKVIQPTGTSNDSTNINNLLCNGNGKFIFKTGTYHIEEDIIIKSNSILEFEEGAIFIKNPSRLKEYNILFLKDVSNVTLLNISIVGDKYNHIGTSGEWGHGITLQGTTNVKIQHSKVIECWGDGIYIGAVPMQGTRFSGNTWINNVICDDNRRNGLTVSSVKGLYVQNSQFNNSTGADPQAGIDFEPDNDTMFLEGLVFDNIILKSNGKRGVFFCLWLLFGDKDESPIKNVSITMNNVITEGGLYGFETLMSNFTGNAGGDYFNRVAIKNLKGEIILNNCQTKNNFKNGIRLYRWYDAGLKITFNNFKLLYPNGEKGQHLESNAAISLFDPNDSSTPNTYHLGGVEFNDLILIHSRKDPLRKSIIVNDITNKNPAKNFILCNTKKINGTIKFAQMLEESCMVIDQNKVHKLVDTVSGPVMFDDDFYTIFSNKGALTPVTKILDATKMHNEEITFINEENLSYIIKCKDGQSFFPFDSTTLTLSGMGSKVTVKKANDTSWFVTNIYGKWIKN